MTVAPDFDPEDIEPYVEPYIVPMFPDDDEEDDDDVFPPYARAA